MSTKRDRNKADKRKKYTGEKDKKRNKEPDVLQQEVQAVHEELGSSRIQGPEGEPGPQGERGLQGEPGPQGERGLQGEPGPQGERGLQGEPGPQGERGLQGEPGPQGERGLQGEPGPQGERGLQGEPGPQGERGLQGEPGPQGERGLQGEPGPQGERGLQGEPGPLGSCNCGSSYCTIYRTGGDLIIPDQPIHFNHTGISSKGDFIHSGTSLIVVYEGVYKISYNVIFTSGKTGFSRGGAYAIFLNGSIVNSSRYGNQMGIFTTAPVTLDSIFQVNGETIITVPAGGKLELRNIGQTSDNLISNVDNTSINSAGLTIVKLN